MLGPIITDIQGLVLTEEDKELLQHPLIGGVILFSRNYEEPEQLSHLVTTLKELKRKSPLVVSVDHEGGRVQRFRQGFSTIPPMADLGQLYDQDASGAQDAAFHLGWLMAAELLACGLDYSYAPVLDLDFQVSSMIGNRAFHQNPHIVSQLAAYFIAGMHEAGMAAIGKHFPGHGFVAADTHVETPVDSRTLGEIRHSDLVPYQALVRSSVLEGVMTAHIMYDAVDPSLPCFSPFWIREVLRSQLGFSGVIFSDDLSMAGAASLGGYAERAERALIAGCDMILICNNRAGTVTALEHITKFYRFDPAVGSRLQTLYAHSRPADKLDDLLAHPLWRKAQQFLLASTVSA